MKIQLTHSFEDIISIENLLEAWKEFIRGKRSRRDVQEFERNLMENIIQLHKNLSAKTYQHSLYEAFNISDPKPRNIHKAIVRDRLLHHALYRKLYPFFDMRFIFDSYSCRSGKGTHKALDRFRVFGYKVSKNHTRTCWVLKCDIKKFFASIDHNVLFHILEKNIVDRDSIWLLQQIVGSFSSTQKGVGLPLGNLTSQLFVNIYMNEFDQFVKHALKAKYYIRYADDFVIMSDNEMWLRGIILHIENFLRERLHLVLHPDKVFIKTLASGVDFLGWVHFPSHRVLRPATKRRMMRKILASNSPATVVSYRGLLKHGNTFKLLNMI